MGDYCPTNQYFDGLLSVCQPCALRCPKLPPDCLKFNPCTRTTNSPAMHKEVPPTSAGPTITYKTKGPESSVAANDKNYIIIWLVVILIVLFISAVLIMTIMLHRKRKLRAGSFSETSGKMTTKSSLKGADLEQASCQELKKPVAENEDVTNGAGVSIYGNVLSDYLFPLPAVEEGAAILVTTKTSACFNPGPGVRGDAFVEL